MSELNWKEFQVSNPKFGVKLVSELTEEQAKTELCIAIDLIEKIVECNQNAIEISKGK
jgi:hypothetical protein